LTQGLEEITIDLADKNLSHIVGGFWLVGQPDD